jgi:hypothetical protein
MMGYRTMQPVCLRAIFSRFTLLQSFAANRVCFAASNFDQLVWRKEVQFDRSTFTWLGTPTQVEQIL